jgi:predicted solute-binding protein
MAKQKTINNEKVNMKKTRNNTTKPLAELVYNKAIREEIEERVRARYLKRINYLVGANNELMSELEQYERVRKIDELAPDDEV